MQKPPMQRLARIIPVVVVVFVGLVVAVLVARSRSTRVEPGSTPDPARADLRMKAVDIEEQSGGVRWRLNAEQALVFEQEGRTAFRKLNVVVREKEREWTIRAEEGDVLQRPAKTRDIEVRNNVIVTTDDGLLLETTVLRWSGAEQRLWTDVPVRITRFGSVVEGRTFDLRMSDQTVTLSGPVRATFRAGTRR